MQRRDLGFTVIAGVAGGVIGFLSFGLAHAIIIEPIWNRLLGGFAFALAGGVALAFIVHELCGSPPSYRRAVGAGVVAWCVIVPSTAFGAWLRVSGFRREFGEWEVPIELAIALIAGAAAGKLIARSARAAITCGVAGVILVTAMAGPVPVTNSVRARLLFLSFLPMFVCASVCIAAVQRVLAKAVA